MPIYEYQCESCGYEFEKMMKVRADPPPCPECGGEVKKQVSAAGFILKGGGWYKDHYGLKSGGSDKKSDSGSSKSESASTKAKAISKAAASSSSSSSSGDS